jgi:hypothetical protein
MTRQWNNSCHPLTTDDTLHNYARPHSRDCGRLAPRQEGVRCSRAPSKALQVLREAAILLGMTLGGGAVCVWLWNLRMGV